MGELRVMEESADPKAWPRWMLATSQEGVGKEWLPRLGEIAGLGMRLLKIALDAPLLYCNYTGLLLAQAPKSAQVSGLVCKKQEVGF